MRVKKFQERDTKYQWTHDAECLGRIVINRDVMPAEVCCETCGPLDSEEKVFTHLWDIDVASEE